MRILTLFSASLAMLVISSAVHAQSLVIQGEVHTSSYLNTADQTPFWLWVNHFGQIPRTGTFNQSTEAYFRSHYTLNKKSRLFLGMRINGNLGEERFLTPTELYGGIAFHRFTFFAGSRADTLVMAGLSSSNGNLLNARNARPYPRIGLQTDGFLPFGKRYFAAAATWEEGILLDPRFVDKARLHHKNLFLRWGRPSKLRFTFGLEHYAFWGGISPTYGPQPDGVTDYLRAVFAMPGGDEHTQSDQMNVAGNSLGQIFFILEKKLDRYHTELRIVHPYEDASGLGFFNGFDNLYSLFISRKEPVLLKNLVVEFLHTRHQSGPDIKNGVYRHRSGRDNYMNHSMYRSGFTYFGNVMGTPFFYPVVVNENGVSQGIENNRVIAYYLAGSGNLTKVLVWQLTGSYSFNYGHYKSRSKEATYDPVRKQFSGLAKLTWTPSTLPFYLTGALGYDTGTLFGAGEKGQQAGFQLQIGWLF